MSSSEYVRWFGELSIDDVPLVGGKNASLGEMYRELSSTGIRVPNGFATTVDAYWRVVDSDVREELRATLADLDPDDAAALARCGRRCRGLVYGAEFPEDLRQSLLDAFDLLREEYGESTTVAVRSSATAEDLPTASFAGQHETYLNVPGGEALVDACQRCFASLFTDRGIRYRIDHGFDHFKVALSVGVMKMVRADEATSGVLFTLDTDSSFRDVVFVTAAYGLGENVVQGAVDPDEFYVHKRRTFENGARTVLRRRLGDKKIRMIYGHGRSARSTTNVPTPESWRRRFCISDEEVLELAASAMRIEKHYTARAGEDRPMDIEWAKDALDGHLYIVQARPETVASQRDVGKLTDYRLTTTAEPTVTGRAVGGKIATGAVRVLHDRSELDSFEAGEILVSDITTPDWGAVMKRAAAIVTNRGGRTCHAAIVARELGIPAVIGTETATERLETGQIVTVSCAEGDVGHVYDGQLDYEVLETDLQQLEMPRTAMMINLGNPEVAFKHSFLPCQGVGLARLEFIIGETIRAHPLALIHPDRIEDAEERRAVMDLTEAYPEPADFFVEKLSEGVGTIAAAFWPRPVIVRLSDFKTNEYASLLGGAAFEPAEENPMIGFRGASRYTHPSYADAFALECRALLRTRRDMGLSNIRLMVPFCRRVDEAQAVLTAMADNGLVRGEDQLEVYVMCEIPNNVVLIDEFARHFDGFSIGSNDLTQLTLGVDRDSELISSLFDERDPGVRAMLEMAVAGARRNGRHCGICGQAPSDYPEIAEFLVEASIDSISLTPDSFLRTAAAVVELEKRLGRRP